MTVPKISNTRVLVSGLSLSAEASTKTICVSWDITSDKDIDGEWSVEWDDMYLDLSEDVRSARSEQGAYFALQREGERADSAATNPQSASSFRHPDSFGSSTQQLTAEPEYDDEPLPTGPLSTARLLQFENGPNFDDALDDVDLSAFFEARPIVQAPTQIAPDAESPASKTEVLFLLAASTSVPASIKIFFTPTWTPPNTPPSLITVVPKSQFQVGQGLHMLWAEKRLQDLIILEEIAKELELEGSRGTGQGRVKVGVEGGGMDEEAVRREGFMVGEEQRWVRSRFLEIEEEAPAHEIMDPMQGLGISSLRLQTGSSVSAPRSTAADAEEEEDLFALPLSPRSPDMAVSPFSMFRGDSVARSPQPSKLRHVETSLDTTAGSAMSPMSVDTTPTALKRGETTGAPLTPPREVKG